MITGETSKASAKTTSYGAGSQNGDKSGGSVATGLECNRMDVVLETHTLKGYNQINIQGQIDKYACGFACLSMIVEFYGGSMTQEDLQNTQKNITESSQGADILLLLNTMYADQTGNCYRSSYSNNTDKILNLMSYGAPSIVVTAPRALGKDWPAHALIPVQTTGYRELSTGTFSATSTMFIDPAYGGRLFTVPGNVWDSKFIINQHYLRKQ